MVDVISQVISYDFNFCKDDSNKWEGEDICAYQSSSSTVQEIMESLLTNILSSGPFEGETSSDSELPIFLSIYN